MTITINGLNIGDVYAGGTRIKRIYRGGGYWFLVARRTKS